MALEAVNFTEMMPDVAQAFEIVCNPDTDLWEKPPNTHSFTAPIIYQTAKVGDFKSARITVSADWKDLYDQGGLAIIAHAKDGSRKWVKTGIEFMNGEPHVSTVTTDTWSDWSLRSMASKSSSSATIAIVNEDDGSLWVYLMGEDGKKLPLREITWWATIPHDYECWIGPYAAKPAKAEYTLKVTFKDFTVNIEKDAGKPTGAQGVNLE